MIISKASVFSVRENIAPTQFSTVLCCINTAASQQVPISGECFTVPAKVEHEARRGDYRMSKNRKTGRGIRLQTALIQMSGHDGMALNTKS
ncbi:hypothetical protein [Pelobacter propionicus]|uniref:hypothetical protein n=1 Tax=Pelobacter propionicus TaxID=29543 RepID=UPI0018DD3B37|nr:hypothetical protein [Pelobacter propionicus]